MQKIIKILLLVTFVAANSFRLTAHGHNKLPASHKDDGLPPLACPVPGVYTIGPAGDYVSINAAVADLATCPVLTGAYVFEFKSNYLSSIETFPIILPNFSGSSATNTITFRPEAGATGISITSANTTGTLLLDGADYITFDGRPGGIGSSKELTIQNTNPGNSYAILFQNDAIYDHINYCFVRSANNNGNSGATIILGGTNGSTGNDNITISNNDIREVSTSLTPNNAILSSGNTSSPVLYNNNIVISNNNITNFYNLTGNIAAILAARGSSDWTITGNVFSHTFAGISKSISGSFSIVHAVGTQMENFTINNNFVGGTAALSGGGNINIIGSGLMTLFRLSLNPAVVTNLQGNTIWNVIYVSSQSSPLHSVFYLEDGTFNVGNTAGNIIGGATSAGNIAVSLSGPTVTNNFAVINCGGGTTMGTVNISNNFIGNLDVAGTSATAGVQVIRFSGSTGVYTINNNMLGSSNHTPSINQYLFTDFAAIDGNMSAGNHTISNNSINNVWLPALATSSVLYGIRLRGNASYSTISNTLSGFRSSSTSANFYTAVGISNTATADNQLISGNKILIFSTSSSSSRAGLAGIYYAGAAGGTNIIEKNFIHSFSPNSSVTSTAVTGIHAAGGTAIYRNNMIRMGITSAGGQLASAYSINGILEDGGTNDFYFNSVYIGGGGVTAGENSYAFNSSITGSVSRNCKNNIFFNARSNASGFSPAHYAIKVSSNVGLSSDNNVLYATGTGNVLANFAGSNIATLASWRTTIGGDLNSYSADPQFISPMGTSATLDLHIKPAPATTVVEANGLNIPSVTDDYDVQARASLTPTDIGADAGNFLAVARADVGPINLINPTVFACNTTGVQVRVMIKNYNNSLLNFAASPVTVFAAITGAVTTNLAGVVNTGTLAAGDSLLVTLTGTLNMTNSGAYIFNISTSVAGGFTDLDVTNNTYVSSVTPSTYNVGTLSSSVYNFCNSGIPTLSLTGTAGTVQWQQSTVSGTGPWANVGSNSLTFIPPSITATTYYRALVSCGASNGSSNVDTVFVIPASVANTAALANGFANSVICQGTSITLTQSGGSIASGASWQWYEGTPTNNFITPIGPVLTSADASLTITPVSSATYYVRASGGTAPCDGYVPPASTGNPAAVVTVNVPGTWLGNSTDWTDVNNWCGGVPTATTDALIPTGLSNYPVISSAQSVRNISINPGAIVTLNATGQLSIKGNYSNNAGTIANNGRVILNGNTQQIFPGITANVAAMKELEIDNSEGVSIDQSFTISGKLQPTNGTLRLNNNNVTIKSDPVATASVGQLGPGASFEYNGTGKFIVERFIPAKRAWRLLTAPVTAASSGSINNNWQEGATKWPMGPATPLSNPFDGYGVHISGGTNANGYDQNVTGNPSIKIFNGGSWTGLPVTTSLYTQKVTDEPGYMLFVRGSRAVDLSFGVNTVPDNTVLRTSGHLKVANTAPVTVTGTGLTVLGNPFASAINFNSIASLNGFSLGENKYYVWDPTLTGAYGVGAWVTLAYNGSTYDRTVTAFNDYGTSGGSQGIDNIGTIQSGAAVMVDLGSTTRTINLNETIKTDGSTNLVFRPVVRKQMRTNLYVDHNNSVSLIDGVLINYGPSYSNNADNLDVDKFYNSSENLGVIRQGKVLAIERRSPVNERDTVFFNTSQMRARNYQFVFEPDSMAANNLACYLEDNYRNVKTPISLKQRTVVPFSVTDDPSAAWERFRLVFKPWMQFVSSTAILEDERIRVNWAVDNEEDLERYEVERSEDGIHFSVIGTVTGKVLDNNHQYAFNETYPEAGLYYYRIKAISRHDVIQYSTVSKVTILNSKSSLYVFPNPVTDSKVNLQLPSSSLAGDYHLSLRSGDGKLICIKKVYHPGGTATVTLIPPVQLTSGIYRLEVLLPDKLQQHLSLMVK